MTFTGKTVVVTGGSAGIGLATACAFAERGAHVVVTGRSQTRLAEAVRRYPSLTPVVADVSSDDDAHRVTAGAAQRFGRLDVLVNKRS